MVFFKTKAGGLPPHADGAEHILSASASKQTPRTVATTGKVTKAPATPGATESRSDQRASEASRDGPPSVGASLRTEGSRRSAVRISRSSGMKKSSSKAKKNKSATKKKTAGGPTKSNKNLPRGGALPPRPAMGGKKAAKKATPRAEPKKIAKKNIGDKGDEARDAPEKNSAGEKTTGTTPPPKPGGVLKGCKSDDNDRNDTMENGAKAIGGLDSAMVAAVANGDMTQVHTYLNESIVRIRSLEGDALKMRDDLVHDSKTGLQDIGRDASEWGETKKAELTEHVIPTLFADGKTFITEGLAALAAGCGVIWNNLMVNPGKEAKDAAVGEAGEKVEASENKVEKEEGKHLTDFNIPDDIAPQLSAITEDDLPIPEDGHGEEGVVPKEQQKEPLEQEKADVVEANVESERGAPLIEPISPAVPSEIREEVDEPEPKTARKKKTMWGRTSKKSSK